MPTSSSEIAGSRGEALTEGYKGLLLVNGGGAVALLTFLTANWENHSLARVTLMGIAFMGLGLVFASLVPLFRYFHWHAQDKFRAEEKDRRTWQWMVFVVCFALSALSFAFALGHLVSSAWSLTYQAT
jgi:hypothetical protein